jgi:hypothetical protein
MNLAMRENPSWIPQGGMSTTTRLAALREQIQSACHLQGLTLMAAEKSSWWGRVNPTPPNQTTEEITREAEEEMARAVGFSRDADRAARKRHRGQQDDS